MTVNTLLLDTSEKDYLLSPKAGSMELLKPNLVPVCLVLGATVKPPINQVHAKTLLMQTTKKEHLK